MNAVNNLVFNPLNLHTTEEKLAFRKLGRFTPDQNITQSIKSAK